MASCRRLITLAEADPDPDAPPGMVADVFLPRTFFRFPLVPLGGPIVAGLMQR